MNKRVNELRTMIPLRDYTAFDKFIKFIMEVDLSNVPFDKDLPDSFIGKLKQCIVNNDYNKFLKVLHDRIYKSLNADYTADNHKSHKSNPYDMHFHIHMHEEILPKYLGKIVVHRNRKDLTKLEVGVVFDCGYNSHDYLHNTNLGVIVFTEKIEDLYSTTWSTNTVMVHENNNNLNSIYLDYIK